MLITLITQMVAIGLEAARKHNQKPIEEWTEEEAGRFLADYRAAVEATRTDAILGPPDQAKGGE